jgi:outer membrane protein assembly factor BamB
VRAYDPETGKVIWELGGVQGQHMATPVADAEHLYLGVGGMMSAKKPLLAVRAGARGDITLKTGETSNAGVAWLVTRAGPSMASPLLYRGLLYILDQNSDVLTSHDAKTGKQVYRERLTGAKGFTSSPWAGGGKVYCLDREGTTYAVEAGPAFKLLATSPLNERCWASPAVAQGTVLVRAVEHLYSIKE